MKDTFEEAIRDESPPNWCWWCFWQWLE